MAPDNLRLARHEAGHAVAAFAFLGQLSEDERPEAKPFTTVTIIHKPGEYYGRLELSDEFTLAARENRSESLNTALIKILLAGEIAEEWFYGSGTGDYAQIRPIWESLSLSHPSKRPSIPALKDEANLILSSEHWKGLIELVASKLLACKTMDYDAVAAIVVGREHE